MKLWERGGAVFVEEEIGKSNFPLRRATSESSTPYPEEPILVELDRVRVVVRRAFKKCESLAEH